MTRIISALLFLALSPRMYAQGTATYNVLFEAVWNGTTHPTDFPSNAHFSGLIGATHDTTVTFWEQGELASPGIQNMAEKGSKSPLDAEIDSAAGSAEYLLSGGGTGSPGSVSLDFSISESHSHVTLVTMVAPSPDWFVGVNGLQLYRNGAWIDTTIQLYPWDAGTDDGLTFTSADSPSSPHVPIALITGSPFSGTPPVATFTFTRTSTAGVPEQQPAVFALRQNYPNPFNPATTIEYTIEGVRGQGSGVSAVKLLVYDLLGSEIATLVNETKTPGTYSVEWNASEYPSGVYFYTLTAGTFHETKKMVLLR